MKLYDLKLARDRAGLTQEDIAESLGVSRQAVSMWETGKKSPSSRNLKKLADLLNVSVDSLLRGDELMSAPSEDNKKAPAGSPGEGEKRTIISMDDWITVPIVSREWTACCGTGITAADITNENEGVIKVNRKMFYRLDDRRMPFAIYCEGDCLESAGIRDGYLAVINPAEDPTQGGIALVSIAGSLSLKRFYSMPNGDVLLKSDRDPIRLTPDQMERDEFSVYGVLADVHQGRPKPLPL